MPCLQRLHTVSLDGKALPDSIYAIGSDPRKPIPCRRQRDVSKGDGNALRAGLFECQHAATLTRSGVARKCPRERALSGILFEIMVSCHHDVEPN